MLGSPLKFIPQHSGFRLFDDHVPVPCSYARILADKDQHNSQFKLSQGVDEYLYREGRRKVTTARSEAYNVSSHWQHEMMLNNKARRERQLRADEADAEVRVQSRMRQDMERQGRRHAMAMQRAMLAHQSEQCWQGASPASPRETPSSACDAEHASTAYITPHTSTGPSVAFDSAMRAAAFMEGAAEHLALRRRQQAQSPNLLDMTTTFRYELQYAEDIIKEVQRACFDVIVDDDAEAPAAAHKLRVRPSEPRHVLTESRRTLSRQHDVLVNLARKVADADARSPIIKDEGRVEDAISAVETMVEGIDREMKHCLGCPSYFDQRTPRLFDADPFERFAGTSTPFRHM